MEWTGEGAGAEKGGKETERERERERIVPTYGVCGGM